MLVAGFALIFFVVTGAGADEAAATVEAVTVDPTRRKRASVAIIILFMDGIPLG
jgi:hypothetical protein